MLFCHKLHERTAVVVLGNAGRFAPRRGHRVHTAALDLKALVDMRRAPRTLAREEKPARHEAALATIALAESRSPFEGRYSLCLSQTNRIFKLPATTPTEIESLHFGKMRDFPARAWHVRARSKSGVVRGIRSIKRGGVAPVR